MTQSCSNCRFFNGVPVKGWCLRYPPVPVVDISLHQSESDRYYMESKLDSAFPAVTENDWCGEWQERKTS